MIGLIALTNYTFNQVKSLGNLSEKLRVIKISFLYPWLLHGKIIFGLIAYFWEIIKLKQLVSLIGNSKLKESHFLWAQNSRLQKVKTCKKKKGRLGDQ